MTAIVEIGPQVFAIQVDGHMLRQHYFTKPAALVAAAQLRSN